MKASPVTARMWKMMEKLTERVSGKIYIVMERAPSPYSEFVEVEDSLGKGISVGRWVQLGRRYALEIDDPRKLPTLAESVAKVEKANIALKMEKIVPKEPTIITHSFPRAPVSSSWCDCGKHKSECCCGESHNGPSHPSGRAYYDEEWEQFAK